MNPPKPTNRQTPFFSNLLFTIALLLFFAAVGGFFGFMYLADKSQKQYNDLEKQWMQERTPQQKEVENQVLNYKQKLQDFAIILNQHTAPSHFLTGLEKIIYPKIYFTKMIITPLNQSVLMEGIADSFDSLAKQMLIFKKDTTVFSNVDLIQINLDPKGAIAFSLKAKIKSDVIAYK